MSLIGDLVGWKAYAAGGVAIALMSFGAGFHLSSNLAETRQTKALATQKSLLIGKCNDIQAETQHAQNALQTQYDIIADKLQSTNSVKLPTPNPSGVSAIPREHAGYAIGVSEYQAKCEQIRQTLFNCEGFLQSERQATHP